MAKIDPFMKPEMDEFGHPVHYVAKCSPGLHIGENCEVWAKYWKTEGGKWDVGIYKMRFENGHVRMWDVNYPPPKGGDKVTFKTWKRL